MPFDGQARWQLDILAADKTAQAFNSVDRRLKSLEGGVAGLGRTMATGIGQTVAFGRGLGQLAVAYGVVAAAHKAFEAGLSVGDLGEQAEQLGVSTDQLQAYRLMAAQAGVTSEQLDAAILKLGRAMGTANDGSDEMIARFQKLGVNILDADKNLRPVAAILPEVARGMLKVSSDTERSAMMAELFGKSGARLKTMLEEWAQGNDRLVDSAKSVNAVAGPDAIKAWDKVGDSLKVAEQRYSTMAATFAAPVATAGLDMINLELAKMTGYLAMAQKGWSWLTNKTGTSLEGMQKEAGDVQARIDKLSAQPRTTLSEAEMQREYARLGMLQQRIADQQTAAYMPTITVTAEKPGVANPTGTKAGAAGAKLDDRLKELQNERAALEKALAAFDKRGLETVDEIDKRLDTQVKLDKKIYDVLKDVPPNSPLAQQLVQEATAVSQLNTKLDERKRLLTEAEQVTQQYGDGTLAAARSTDQLNKMLAAGALDAGTYERALKATKQAAEDQERAARGAAGGFGGLSAGVEQGVADMARANSAFEVGKRGVQDFSTAVSAWAASGFQDIQSFEQAMLSMLANVAMAIAQSELLKLFGAGAKGGGSGGGILDMLGGGGGGTGGGILDSIFSATMGSPFMFAEGGNYQAGKPRITGEKGWELDIPSTSGTVLNQRQLANLFSGGSQSGGRIDIHVHENGELLRMEIDNRSNANIARAAPSIVKQSVKQANSQVVGVMDRNDLERGGDYRG